MANKTRSQVETLLHHFTFGGILTSAESYYKFGITQLATRIGELEKSEGIELIRLPVKKNGKRFIQYFMSAADRKRIITEKTA